MNLSKDTRLARAGLWILKNEMACYVVGVFFSILMFIGLGFWIKGCDAEPITFAFSVLTSIAFALPPAAMRLTEARPLERMNYDELMELIARTEKPDWKCVSDDGIEEFLYLRNPSLRIKHFAGEEGSQNEDFKEVWANRFPDPRAYGLYFDLYYAGERLKRIILVAVDGCKAYLPCPEPGSLLFKPLNGKVATIANYDSRLYTEYLKRAGLSQEKAEVSV